jgi:hypothetical protein
MNSVKLLDRMDKKYTFPAFVLDTILEDLQKDYKILTIEGKKFANYETRYFDTPDFEMYTRHHNSHLNRHKVRFRTYLDSNLHFCEVKFKTNKGRTIKKRVLRPVNDFSFTTEALELLKRKTPYAGDDLQEAIRVYYKRITLVNNNMKERITIDFDLHYYQQGNTRNFPNMIIAEVKQDKSGVSPFIELMKTLRIKDISISKYCLGVASLASGVKTNNFKIKLHYVEKLCNCTA